MQRDPDKYIFDALSACDAILEFTKNKTLEEYSADLMLRSAVERQFEILGEAFCRLDNISDQYRAECSDVGDIIGMRNRIIHGYDNVDDDILWDTVQKNLPDLRKWLRGHSSSACGAS